MSAGEHNYYHCTCNRQGCMFCDGGLSYCTVCGGFEGTLPTECPGAKLYPSTHDDIWKRGLDFEHGRWVYPKRAAA